MDVVDDPDFADGKRYRETQKAMAYWTVERDYLVVRPFTLDTSITLYTDFFYVLFIIRDS